VTAIAVAVVVVLILLLAARDLVARRRERQLLEELGAMRSQVKENDRLVNVGQLVSGLAQDLKSPLQGALGSAELLAASGPSGHDSAQELQEIRDNVTRAVGIVRNLLAFTETGALDRRWHDLNEIVRDAVQRHRTSGQAGDAVGFQGPERLQLIYIDGRQIEKVLATVLQFTAHARRPGESAAVAVATHRVSGPTDRMVIDIDDPVASEADEELAWSADLDGCRRILQAHGGSLEVEHRGAGGLRFHLELPVTELVETEGT
jgi:K+-sensing histidine kinase KdpD